MDQVQRKVLRGVDDLDFFIGDEAIDKPAYAAKVSPARSGCHACVRACVAGRGRVMSRAARWWIGRSVERVFTLMCEGASLSCLAWGVEAPREGRLCVLGRPRLAVSLQGEVQSD